MSLESPSRSLCRGIHRLALQVDGLIFDHQVTLMGNYQLVAVLGELGSTSDSPSPHYQAAPRSLAAAAGRGGCEAALCCSCGTSPALRAEKTAGREIFVNDQMPCEFDSRGPGLTSGSYLVLRDLAGFDPEGTAQLLRPLALPVVRDFKSEINRGEAEGLVRAV